MDFDTAYQTDKKIVKLEEKKSRVEEDREKAVDKNYPKSEIVHKQEQEVFFNEDGSEFKGPMHKDHIPASIGMMGMVIAFGLMALKLSLGALGLESISREAEILWEEKKQEEVMVGKETKDKLKIASREAELKNKVIENKEERVFFIKNYFNEDYQNLDLDKNGVINLEDYRLLLP